MSPLPLPLPSTLLLQILTTLLSATIIYKLYHHLIYNLFLHPLAKFPGPFPARATDWYKTYIEVYKQQSMVHLLVDLHREFGDVVRIAPNELHFANPAAYHDIYNAKARWDKETTLYRSFGEDESSFGFLTYAESKQRKDVMQPLFSRRAILSMQGLVWSNIDILVSKLTEQNALGRSADLLFALRAFTMDMVTTFCFARTVNAMEAVDFRAPIVEAMNVSTPTFVMLKHFPLFRKILFSLPPWLAIKASPETAGLTNLQVMLGAQVKEVLDNPKTLENAPHPIIYHTLLDRDAHKGQGVPSARSLYQEAQALMFAGGDSVANTLMVGIFHVLEQPETYQRLNEEIKQAWPVLEEHPSFETLEALPLLTATIKESLRVAPGVPSPLLRVVPPQGALVGGKTIPGGAVVGMSTVLVHTSNEIFQKAEAFDIDRWTNSSSAGLDQWLVTFSKGPRSCLGINLAYCEMYVAMATLMRKFELRLDGTRVEDLAWRDTFLPDFTGRHLHAWCEPVKA